jgi:hypothetical protein
LLSAVLTSSALIFAHCFSISILYDVLSDAMHFQIPTEDAVAAKQKPTNSVA